MVPNDLHVFFIPLMAHGHMIPMIDIAKSFAQHGVIVSIITTPLNAALFQTTIKHAALRGHRISFRLLRFPCSAAGLPDGCENTDHITSPAMLSSFFNALAMLEAPFDRLVAELRPDCIVSDVFLPWTARTASRQGVPRLFFNGSGFFSTCAWESLSRHRPHEGVASDSESFLLPGLPDKVRMKRSQLPDFFKEQNGFAHFLGCIKEANEASYGLVMNTFYELEPAYADHYRDETGTKAWNVGPVSLSNRYKAESDEQADSCLAWLDCMKPASVVYVAFGSVCSHSPRQLREIAAALEASGNPFIWVVRKDHGKAGGSDEGEWLPEGFEERVGEKKGLIIRGWAPQVAILGHSAIGAFVTHCGWNSVVEGISGGVPMVTWPAFAEQFCNEKMVTEVTKVGVAVGVEKWVAWPQAEWPLVKREEIERAVRRVMEEGGEMRRRARELGEKAKKAAGEGGSSWNGLRDLIQELKLLHCQRKKLGKEE